MSRAQRGFVLLVLALSLMSCTTPDAVSKFCGSAGATLTSASSVFDDMKLSCLREIDSRNEFGTFKPSVQSDPNCAAIGDQAAGAAAAAKILSDYFSAINSLASFGTAKAGTDAQNLLSKTGAAVGASSAAQTALGSIAQFLVSAATSGYQRKQLEKECAVKGAGHQRVQLPPGNWFAPPGSNRGGSGGNKAVGALGVKGR